MVNFSQKKVNTLIYTRFSPEILITEGITWALG